MSARLKKHRSLKRKNNRNKKIEEIKDLIRREEYTIHKHFKERFEERGFTHKEVRRIIFDGNATFEYRDLKRRVLFEHKKNSVVIEFTNKQNGKILDITLITVY